MSPARGLGAALVRFGALGALTVLGACDGKGGGGDDTSGDDGAPLVLPEDCAALPAAPSGAAHASPGDDLPALVAALGPGETLVLDAGTYELGGGDTVSNLLFTAPGVVLRGATGDPADVVLDGLYGTSELLTVRADGVVLADLTIRRASRDAVRVSGDGTADVAGVSLFRVLLEDSLGTQLRVDAERGTYADEGLVACSSFSFSDDARAAAGAGCAPGGIDALQASGWRVRDSHFRGFWCPSSNARPAVRFATGSADPVVERNLLHDNAVGISLGATEYEAGDERVYDAPPCEGTGVGIYGGVARNNMISATAPELTSSGRLQSGILYAEACGAAGYHNSVYLEGTFRASEQHTGAYTNITLLNELLIAPIQSAGGSISLDGIITNATAADFVDPVAGDLHLVAGSAAEDAEVAVPEGAVPDDFDGEARGAPADVGADER